jgi:hypothetical protein
MIIRKTFSQFMSEASSTLDDLRSASARATMTGPSKEAQSLMSTRTKNLIGQSKLQAGTQAQQGVETMKSQIPSSSSTLPAPNAAWAKANPTLATAYNERQRIRGTAQSDNPMLRTMRSAMPPVTPSVQSKDVSSLGKGFQSLTQNPNALQAPTATKTITPDKPSTTAPTAPPLPAQPKAPVLNSQQQDLYKQAYSNRNNPFAQGRIKSEFSKLTPDQQKAFKDYAKDQGHDWGNLI